MVQTLLEEEMLERAIGKIRKSSFTVLDFIGVFRNSYPREWGRLVKRFGLFGQGRRYTVTTYTSNRLDLYSQRQGSMLKPFRRYSKAKSKDYRRTTEAERKRFGSPWIAIFTKRR